MRNWTFVSLLGLAAVIVGGCFASEGSGAVSTVTDQTQTDVAQPAPSLLDNQDSLVAKPEGDDVETSVHELLERHRRCVEDRGFPLQEEERTADGSQIYSYAVAESQQAAFRAAMDECYGEVGLLDGSPIPPPSPEYLSNYFDFLVALKGCVDDHATFSVPDPPSRESFIESGGSNWHPYDPRWMSASPEEFVVLESACPQDFSG